MRAHRFFDDTFGFMRQKSRPGAEVKDDGRGDSVGLTVRAAIIYREKRFIYSLWSIFNDFIYCDIWNPRRHPNDTRKDFSRDHTVWFIIWLIYFFPEHLHRALKIPWRISEKHTQRGIYLWIRAVARGRWCDRLIYWAVTGLILRFDNLWNKWLRRRAGIVSVDYKQFKATPYDQLSNREKFARKYSIPDYSFEIQAFMIRCLKDGWFKERFKKRLLPCIEKTNWHVRKVLDDEFTAAEKLQIENYTGMDGLRAARYLCRITKVELNALSGPQPEYNMDVDYLHANLEIDPTFNK